MKMPHRLGAEFLGTLWLVFGGCGSAVLAAGFPALGIGFTGVALAFGLTVLTVGNDDGIKPSTSRAPPKSPASPVKTRSAP
jgi:hypothetical protein